MNSFFEFMRQNAFGVAGGVFMVAYGLIALVRPDVVMRWVGGSDLERYPDLSHLVRGLGGFIAVMGLLGLNSL